MINLSSSENRTHNDYGEGFEKHMGTVKQIQIV